MMGIDPAKQRDMMEESLEAILACSTGDEPVTMETDWFTLRDARLQLRPYSAPLLRDRGGRPGVAGRAPRRRPLRLRPAVPRRHHGRRASTSSARTGTSWRSGRPSSAPPSTAASGAWSGPMHIAETEEQARQDVEFGLAEWVDYFQRVAALPLAPDTDDVDLVDALNAIGLRRDRHARRWPSPRSSACVDQSGGFGTFLFMAHEWADREATLHSYELFARYVVPLFQGSTPSLVGSRDWAAANRPDVHRRRHQRRRRRHHRAPRREGSQDAGPVLSRSRQLVPALCAVTSCRERLRGGRRRWG